MAEAVIVLEVANDVLGVLGDEPIAVAAFFPLGEVGGGDGTVLVLRGEDGFDLGQGV